MGKSKIHPCGEDSDSAPPPPPRAPPVRAPATNRRPRRVSSSGGSGCVCSSACCCCTIFIMVILFIIWLYIMLFTLRLPKVVVESIHVSGLNTTSSAVINTSISSELMMRNPNQLMGMTYEYINVEVKVDGLNIGSRSIPSFSQGRKSSANFTFESSSGDLTLTSDTIALLAENLTNAPLHADVNLQANSKLGSMLLFRLSMTIGCDLNVDLTRYSGSQLTHQHCEVDDWNMPGGVAY